MYIVVFVWISSPVVIFHSWIGYCSLCFSAHSRSYRVIWLLSFISFIVLVWTKPYWWPRQQWAQPTYSIVIMSLEQPQAEAGIIATYSITLPILSGPPIPKFGSHKSKCNFQHEGLPCKKKTVLYCCFRFTRDHHWSQRLNSQTTIAFSGLCTILKDNNLHCTAMVPPCDSQWNSSTAVRRMVSTQSFMLKSWNWLNNNWKQSQLITISIERYILVMNFSTVHISSCERIQFESLCSSLMMDPTMLSSTLTRCILLKSMVNRRWVLWIGSNWLTWKSNIWRHSIYLLHSLCYSTCSTNHNPNKD